MWLVHPPALHRGVQEPGHGAAALADLVPRPRPGRADHDRAADLRPGRVGAPRAGRGRPGLAPGDYDAALEHRRRGRARGAGSRGGAAHRCGRARWRSGTRLIRPQLSRRRTGVVRPRWAR